MKTVDGGSPVKTSWRQRRPTTTSGTGRIDYYGGEYEGVVADE
jgi:hypothetical protein